MERLVSCYLEKVATPRREGSYPIFRREVRTVLGSLDKKGGANCHLLLEKRWHLLSHFLSNEPGTG
jgi:hypothetical protein